MAAIVVGGGSQPSRGRVQLEQAEDVRFLEKDPFWPWGCGCKQRSLAGAAALGGAADGEGEGRPDPQVLATNDGRVGRSVRQRRGGTAAQGGCR